MPRVKNGDTSNFYCTQCGNKGVPIWRRAGAEREAGHLKRLFCLNCNKETNHVECRQGNAKYTYEDFLIEFEHNNFDTDGNRVMSYGELRKAINNGKI